MKVRLAQAAERVLQGDIPHRDFDESYTGWLSYLNAVLEVTPGFIYEMGRTYKPDTQSATLRLARVGLLRVDSADERVHGSRCYCFGARPRALFVLHTDCPEVYLLFRFRNPGRTLFDFFEESEGRTSRILATLREHNVNLVALNDSPGFSGPVPINLRTALEREFPNHATTQRL